MKHLLWLAPPLLIAAISCAKKETNQALPPPPPPPADAYRENGNIAALAHGAVITHRDGEATLRSSAILSIDSSLETVWSGPPGDPRITATIALPSRYRVDRIGLSGKSPLAPARSVRHIHFESSVDGVTFRPLGEIRRDTARDGDVIAVPPAEASMLRVSVAANHSGDTTDLASIEAHGRLLAPRAVVDVSGRWKVNDFVLSLRQERQIVEGMTDESPALQLNGVIHDNVARFTWTRGAEVGFGVLAVDPAARVLNAVFWHEKPIALFLGGSWYGERESTSGTFKPLDQRWHALLFLQNIGRFPTYRIGYSSDGSAIRDEASISTLRMLLSIVRANPEREFVIAAFRSGEQDEETNRSVSRKRALALQQAAASLGPVPKNVAFAFRGSHYDHDVPRNELDRPLYDRVDLELVGHDGSLATTIRLR